MLLKSVLCGPKETKGQKKTFSRPFVRKTRKKRGDCAAPNAVSGGACLHAGLSRLFPNKRVGETRLKARIFY